MRNGVVDFADFHQWKAAFLGAGGSLADVDLGFLAAVPDRPPRCSCCSRSGLVCYRARSRKIASPLGRGSELSSGEGSPVTRSLTRSIPRDLSRRERCQEDSCSLS